MVARDRDEAASVCRAAVERGELDVDQRDEDQVAAVEVVAEPAAIALLGQRQVADDPVAIGVEDHAFDSVLHPVQPIGTGRDRC